MPKRKKPPPPPRKPSRSDLPAWFTEFEVEAWTSRHLDLPAPPWFRRPFLEPYKWRPDIPKPDVPAGWLDFLGRRRWQVARLAWLEEQSLTWDDVRRMGHRTRYAHLTVGTANLWPPDGWQPGPPPVRG
jgi:hypothetical protein